MPKRLAHSFLQPEALFSLLQSPSTLQAQAGEAREAKDAWQPGEPEGGKRFGGPSHSFLTSEGGAKSPWHCDRC